MVGIGSVCPFRIDFSDARFVLRDCVSQRHVFEVNAYPKMEMLTTKSSTALYLLETPNLPLQSVLATIAELQIRVHELYHNDLLKSGFQHISDRAYRDPKLSIALGQPDMCQQ